MSKALGKMLAILALVGLISLLPTAAASAFVAGDDSVFISEIHYDNAGADTGEAVEVFGPAGTDLTGWSLVGYNGNGGATYNTVALSGTIADQTLGYGVTSVPFTGLQNGAPDGIALVNASGSVRQFLSYEGSFTATDGPAAGLTSTDIGVTEPSSTAVGSSLQLTGTGSCYDDLTWIGPAPNSFGAINESLTPSAGADCGVDLSDAQLNEIVVSTPSTDWEFIEISGTPGSSLDALTFLEIDRFGVIDDLISLAGESIPAGGLFVAAAPAAEAQYGFTADLSFPNNFLTNNTSSYLLVQGFTGADGDDLDPGDAGSATVMPWDAILDELALVESAGETTYATPALGPDGSFLPAGALRCDGQWLPHSFSGVGDAGTPGAENACATEVFIHEIQGTEDTPLLLGARVIVEGIVVGDYEGPAPALRGFFVQEEDGDTDGDPRTSEGIFVFTFDGVGVNVGDLVRVEGTVAEFRNSTQLTDFVDVDVLSSGHALPSPSTVTFPVAAVSDLEAVEGMLATFPDELVISEYFNYDRFGEIVVAKPVDGEERAVNPTALFGEDSAEALDRRDLNLRSRITVDDGNSFQNPDVNIHPITRDPLTLTNAFRGGDTVTGLTGPVYSAFGLYRVLPLPDGAGYDTYVRNPAPESPDDVGGSLTVATLNALNYFVSLDTADTCGPTQDQDCRGADDQNEFERQHPKLVNAIVGMDADVIGLIEVENTTGVEALAALLEGDANVDGVNDVLGAGTYDYIAAGVDSVVGPDTIKVGIIYRPGAVTPVGDPAILEGAFLDPNGTGEPRNRAALAQTFIDNSTGGVFSVVVNHLKSKGTPCGPGDDHPLAGSCNVTRTLAAGILADWIATDPTGSGDGDWLIIGDLNSYDQETPIQVLRDAEYNDLVASFQGPAAYSYVFNGEVGYLDYAMARQAMVDDGEITGITVWHINADEPDIFDYDTGFKSEPQDALFDDSTPFRSSDHDAVLVGLDVCDEIAPTLEVSVSPDELWPPNHQYVTVSATVTATDNFDPDPTVTLLSVTSNEPDDGLGDGDTANDIVILDDTTFDLRAERSGTGDGRVYTITYEVTDDCGNSSVATATVTVPLDRGRGRR